MKPSLAFQWYGGAILAIRDNSPLYTDPHVCDGDFISSAVRLYSLYDSRILSILNIMNQHHRYVND